MNRKYKKHVHNYILGMEQRRELKNFLPLFIRGEEGVGVVVLS